jgi:hypothetical protein
VRTVSHPIGSARTIEARTTAAVRAAVRSSVSSAREESAVSSEATQSPATTTTR